MTGPKVGFFSGFHAVDAILQDPPKWTIQINDTDPVFYYCSAPGSCTEWVTTTCLQGVELMNITAGRWLESSIQTQLLP